MAGALDGLRNFTTPSSEAFTALPLGVSQRPGFIGVPVGNGNKLGPDIPNAAREALQNLLGLVTLPGDVVSGSVDPLGQEAMKRAAAGTVTAAAPSTLSRRTIPDVFGSLGVPEQKVINFAEAKANKVSDQIRKQNFQKIGKEEGAAITHELSNGYSIATRPGDPGPWGHKFILVSPQGGPVLYGNSTDDLIRRGFYSDETPSIISPKGTR